MDVIVPVYGGWEHVRACLASLVQQTIPVHVIVVDDRSPDDTLARVRDEFESFTVIANSANLGFASSCNVGIRAGAAPFVVLMNSDVEAHPRMAETILKAFEESEDRCGSVAPILRARDGTVDSFGICADVTLAGYVRWHGAETVDTEAMMQGPALLGPYGALAAYRRAALDEVGLLDEHIFMYGEELELALRLRAADWTAQEIPAQLGVHIGGASAGVESSRQRYLSGFGRAYTLRVYRVLLSRHALRTAATELTVVAARLIARKDIASIRGRIDGWRAGRGVAARPRPRHGLDERISFRRSLRMRAEGFWRAQVRSRD